MKKKEEKPLIEKNNTFFKNFSESKFITAVTRFFSNLKRIILLIAKKFMIDFGPQRAASLAYSTFLSMVPITLLALSILTSLRIFSEVELQLETFISENFFPTFANNIMEYIDVFSEKLSSINGISLVAFLSAGIFLLVSLENHLNSLWKVEKRRTFMRAITGYWTTLTLGPVLIGVSVYISQQFKWMALAGNQNEFTLKLLSTLITFVITAILFSILNLMIPNIKVKVKAAVSAGVFTAVGFEGLRFVFNRFASNFPHNYIYGSIAVIFLFLLWIFVIWLIFLIGTEIAYFVQFPPVQKEVDTSRRNLFTREIAIFLFIVHDYVNNKRQVTSNIIQDNFIQFKFEEIDAALDSLLEHKLIMESEERGFIPYNEPVTQNLGELMNHILGLSFQDEDFLNPKELEKNHPEIYCILNRVKSKIEKGFKENIFEAIEEQENK